MIEAAIETEATPASRLFEFRSHGLQLLHLLHPYGHGQVTHGGAGGIHRWLVDAVPVQRTK